MIIPLRLRQMGWNRRVLSYADFEQACEDFDITLVLRRFADQGEYYVDPYWGDVIVLDNTMPDPLRSMVAWHEFGHALLHIPGHYRGFDEKAEYQADLVGLVALIPDTLFRRYTDGEISEQYGYPLRFIQHRREVARYVKFQAPL